MSEKKDDLGEEPVLQRVRCCQCRQPLVQVYEGDLLYTCEQGTKQIHSQPVAAYSYRTLTDLASLLHCPRCGAALSPATVTVVLPGVMATEERNER